MGVYYVERRTRDRGIMFYECKSITAVASEPRLQV